MIRRLAFACCEFPYSLRIFVADGDPDGLRVVERSNWIGKALVFPRALLPRVKVRDEIGQTGVYLLHRPREDCEGEMLYIGEGDPIRPRLASHSSRPANSGGGLPAPGENGLLTGSMYREIICVYGVYLLKQ